MPIHRWTPSDLGRVWLKWLSVHVVLVAANHLWASNQHNLGVAGLAQLLLVLVVVWTAIPTGLLLVTFAWYWSRRRTREIQPRELPPNVRCS